MEKTQGRIWKTSMCAYLCVKTREWEQDHFSSSAELSLPAPSPPFAAGVHVCDSLLKGNTDTLNLTQYCPKIKQTLSRILARLLNPELRKQSGHSAFWVLIFPFQLWAHNTMSNFNLASALDLATAYLDFPIIALGILKAFSAEWHTLNGKPDHGCRALPISPDISA